MPASCGTRGVVVINYPQDGIQNGSPDGIALVSPTGQVLEFLSYEGVVTATHRPRGRIGFHRHSRVADERPRGLVAAAQLHGSLGVRAPRASAPAIRTSPTPVGNTLSFSGRVPSDPALPVGYEDQIFATLRSPGNVTIPTTITWTSETPAIASIDANGVMRALAEGTGHRARDGGGRHHGYLLAAHARGGGERRRVPGQHRVR